MCIHITHTHIYIYIYTHIQLLRDQTSKHRCLAAFHPGTLRFHLRLPPGAGRGPLPGPGGAGGELPGSVAPGAGGAGGVRRGGLLGDSDRQTPNHPFGGFEGCVSACVCVCVCVWVRGSSFEAWKLGSVLSCRGGGKWSGERWKPRFDEMWPWHP